ncbi:MULTISPECIES: hypothetical protein [Citrobacter freundii complex]|uniref:Uncharacterized protein n=1 Tax=Citrobacter freundii TaxID=546 RepID=A0AAP9QDR6_CITFR|nr:MULTISPECIES: hypothetical protein [Citrobacter freundii complex]QLV31340.1 hypothetical protein HV178_15775 [Citrobacter freundii]HED1840877.1 hypothetical protein [Citrobacter freundii]
MKYQLAKLYRGDRFFGYGIAVGGLLLDGQASTVVETSPNEIPRVITTFNLSNEHSEEQPRIDLDKPRVSNEIMFAIHPDRPLTSSQSEELKEVLNDFLSRHNL